MTEAKRQSPQKDTDYKGEKERGREGGREREREKEREKNEELPVAIRVHRGLCIAEVLGSSKPPCKFYQSLSYSTPAYDHAPLHHDYT